MSASTVQGWSYRCYHGDLDAGKFGLFETFVELWRSKIHSGIFPSWREFEFEEFEEWWGRLSLAEIKNAPFDLEFILWGTQLTNWWSIDYTRKNMSEAYEGRQENWEQYEGPYFRSLIEHHGIGMICGTLTLLDREFIHVQGVDVLLTKDDEVSQVLSCYAKLGSEQPKFPDVEPVFIV